MDVAHVYREYGILMYNKYFGDVGFSFERDGAAFLTRRKVDEYE